MKKLKLAGITAGILLGLGACLPNAMAAEVGTPQILWQNVGGLSPAVNYKENIGVAGMLVGSSNGYLVVAGGANFPEGGPAVGGKKVTYSDLYVFKPSPKGLVEVSHSQMNYPVAYGSSVITKEGIYYLGGSTDAVGSKTISLVKVNDDGKAIVEAVGELPFAFRNGVAAYYKDKIYFGLGNENGKAGNEFYSFDVKTKALTKLADFPGATREQAVAQVLNGKLYVFGGGTKTALTDGYAYDIATNTWSKVADVVVDNQEISLLGANSVKLNHDEMLVIGGFNKKVYDWAVANLSTLKDGALKSFKDHYFNMPVRDYNWNKDILVYNAKLNQWRSVGQVPFNAPCGEGLVKMGNEIFSINGEIKPGVRINEIYQGFIKAEKVKCKK